MDEGRVCHGVWSVGGVWGFGGGVRRGSAVGRGQHLDRAGAGPGLARAGDGGDDLDGGGVLVEHGEEDVAEGTCGSGGRTASHTEKASLPRGIKARILCRGWIKSSCAALLEPPLSWLGKHGTRLRGGCAAHGSISSRDRKIRNTMLTGGGSMAVCKRTMGCISPEVRRHMTTSGVTEGAETRAGTAASHVHLAVPVCRPGPLSRRQSDAISSQGRPQRLLRRSGMRRGWDDKGGGGASVDLLEVFEAGARDEGGPRKVQEHLQLCSLRRGQALPRRPLPSTLAQSACFAVLVLHRVQDNAPGGAAGRLVGARVNAASSGLRRSLFDALRFGERCVCAEELGGGVLDSEYAARSWGGGLFF